jgi:hypothetical protein
VEEEEEERNKREQFEGQGRNMKRFYTATNLRLSKGDHQFSHSSFSLRGMRTDSQDYVKFCVL